MAEQALSGSCLCGAVRYTATGVPKRFYHCHCSRCRKVTGTGHASNLFVEGTLDWQCGKDRVAEYRLPDAKRFANSFCVTCGSRLPRYVPEFNLVFIPAGSLDDEPELRPQARIFADSRSAWSCTAAELPEYPAYPE
ncbi:GFA family protein [Elongatibacter sediminis]|uniref:GFA family protein n=1 Tax=Elongatibacter sediminis TaxID=3119006 RepID=A0AAW9RDB8_9GAMM